MSELRAGDRVEHETLGEGRIDDTNLECGVVLVMFKDGEFGSFASWVALSLLTKVEESTEPQFSELALLLSNGMYDRKVWHGRNLTARQMDDYNNDTAEYLAEVLEEAGYRKDVVDGKVMNEDYMLNRDLPVESLHLNTSEGEENKVVQPIGFSTQGSGLPARGAFVAEADWNPLHDQGCTRECCVPSDETEVVAPQPDKTLRDKFEAVLEHGFDVIGFKTGVGNIQSLAEMLLDADREHFDSKRDRIEFLIAHCGKSDSTANASQAALAIEAELFGDEQ